MLQSFYFFHNKNTTNFANVLAVVSCSASSGPTKFSNEFVALCSLFFSCCWNDYVIAIEAFIFFTMIFIFLSSFNFLCSSFISIISSLLIQFVSRSDTSLLLPTFDRFFAFFVYLNKKIPCSFGLSSVVFMFISSCIQKNCDKNTLRSISL